MRDLEHNLATAEVPAQVVVHPVTVEQYLGDPREPRPELVLLDPPRTGLPKGGAEAVAALGAGQPLVGLGLVELDVDHRARSVAT